MKTDDQIIKDAAIVAHSEPDEYSYPNVVVTKIKSDYYLAGYKKALEDSKANK